MKAFVFIGIGAAAGAWLRWLFGILFNSIFPIVPLGTLAANLLGGYLIGIMMGLTKFQPFFPEDLRLGIVTGFLGGMTTFSTFSAEAVTLFTAQNYFWFASHLALHVVGSICLTVLGILTVKLFV